MHRCKDKSYQDEMGFWVRARAKISRNVFNDVTFFFYMCRNKGMLMFFCLQEMFPETLFFLFVIATEQSLFCFPVLVYVCLQVPTSSGSLKSLLLNFSLLCTCNIWYLSHDSWNFLLIFAFECLYWVWLGFVAVTGFNNLYPRSYNCNEHNFYKSLICDLLIYSTSVSSILGSTQFPSFQKPNQIFSKWKNIASANVLLLWALRGEQGVVETPGLYFFEVCERGGAWK